MCYFCNFSLCLKSFQNKRLIKIKPSNSHRGLIEDYQGLLDSGAGHSYLLPPASSLQPPASSLSPYMQLARTSFLCPKATKPIPASVPLHLQFPCRESLPSHVGIAQPQEWFWSPF